MLTVRIYVNNQQIGSIAAHNIGLLDEDDTCFYEVSYDMDHDGPGHTNKKFKLVHKREQGAEMLIKKILDIVIDGEDED